MFAEAPNVDARRLPRTDWNPLEGRDQSARALNHTVQLSAYLKRPSLSGNSGGPVAMDRSTLDRTPSRWIRRNQAGKGVALVEGESEQALDDRPAEPRASAE